MRIHIAESAGKQLRISLPTGLVLNRFAAICIPVFLQRYGVAITKKQAVAFVTALNRYRRHHPNWVLAEIQSRDGNYIKIKL